MTCVRTAIVDSHELVVAGLTRLLEESPTNSYHVVPLTGGDVDPDVVLYSVDRDGESHHDPQLHALLRGTTSTVIATYWDEASPAVGSALACGVHGALSKRVTADDFLKGIDSIVLGRDPGRPPPPDGGCHPEVARAGLTPRETDVLALIAAGLSNQEIGDRLYISINSVKTYVRTAYQKIGAERRAHAVIWVERNGLTPRAPLEPLDRHDVDAE